MFQRKVRLISIVLCFLWASLAYGLTVTINTDAAKADLVALQNPALSSEEARRIAVLYGNQGVIRKLNEFKIPASTDSFARALYAAAHGEPVTDQIEQDFLFDMIKPKATQLQRIIAQIEMNPSQFQGAIQKRIATFTPPGADIKLTGYIVAAGDGGGYAFGGTDFYLNVGITDDFIVAKDVTTHELYHAVQGAFEKDRSVTNINGSDTKASRCSDVLRLFENLYEEGSAVYVEDPSALLKSHSPIAIRMDDDLSNGVKHVDYSVTLLDMSVLSLESPAPLSYDDVYAVGFYGHGVLYNIGYVMAKAIAEDEGPEALTSLLRQPPYQFVLHYARLPLYGNNKDHPKLGANTLAAASLLLDGCVAKAESDKLL